MAKQIHISSDPDILKPIIEALIFASEEPLPPRMLVKLLAGESDVKKNDLSGLDDDELDASADENASTDDVAGEVPETTDGGEGARGREGERGEGSGLDEVRTEEERADEEPAPIPVETTEEAVGTVDAVVHEGAAEMIVVQDAADEVESGEGESGRGGEWENEEESAGEEPAVNVEDERLSDEAPSEENPLDETSSGETSPDVEPTEGTGADIADAFERAGERVSGRAPRFPATDTIDQRLIRRLVEDLNVEYDETGRAFRIVEVAGGFQFATIREYGEFVGLLSKDKARRRLSPAALETLAIIAYRQPVPKPEIESIRGVNCDQVLLSLLEKSLIAITGRSEAVGRPLLYGTTDEFLRCFGLNSVNDLPKLREIEELMEDAAFTAEKVEVVTVDQASNVEEIEAMVGAAGRGEGERGGVGEGENGRGGDGEMENAAGAAGEIGVGEEGTEMEEEAGMVGEVGTEEGGREMGEETEMEEEVGMEEEGIEVEDEVGIEEEEIEVEDEVGMEEEEIEVEDGAGMVEEEIGIEMEENGGEEDLEEDAADEGEGGEIEESERAEESAEEL